MAEIPTDETPIFTKLSQEYAAREAFYQHFLEDPPPVTSVHDLKPLGRTYALRGGGITVYGDPIAPRDA